MDDHYSNKRSFEWLPVLIAVVFYILIGGSYVFGLGYSFYRFGPTDGIISVLIPPYACYRGVSVLWTEPKWKEDWDLKTGNLAFLVMHAGSNDPQIDFELRQHESRVKKWLQKVPDDERQKLKADSRALGNAIIAYTQEFFSQLSQSGTFDGDLIKSPSIQRHVDQFSRQSGFVEIWTKFDTQQKHMMGVLKKEMDRRSSEMDIDELRLNLLDYMESQGSAQMKLNEELWTQKIESLFEE